MSQLVANSNQIAAIKCSPLPLGAARTNLAKRERGLVLDSVHHLDNSKSDPSPRVLPTPAWLMGNSKITSHGKTTQIGKKGITDWKSVSGQNNANITGTINNSENGHLPDIILPSCPGALSPAKILKPKKLNPMTNLTQTAPNFAKNLEGSLFATPVSDSTEKEVLDILIIFLSYFSGKFRQLLKERTKSKLNEDEPLVSVKCIYIYMSIRLLTIYK